MVLSKILVLDYRDRPYRLSTGPTLSTELKNRTLRNGILRSSFALSQHFFQVGDTYREKLHQRNFQNLCDHPKFGIIYTPQPGFNLRETTSTKIPSCQLELRGQGFLRKTPLHTQATELCANQILMMFYLLQNWSLTLKPVLTIFAPDAEQNAPA